MKKLKTIEKQTIKQKWDNDQDSLKEYDYGCDGVDECCGCCGGDFLSESKVFDWFISRFDAMIAEDIENIVELFKQVEEREDRVEVVDMKAILEARRLSLKSNL